MSNAPIPIAEVTRLAHEEPEGVFVRRLGHGALIGVPPPREDEATWTFHTRAITARFSRAAPGIDLMGSLVHPMKKVHSRFADTMLVGRADSNDVRIEDASVSKLHARVRIEETQLVLCDAGSKNGLQVNYAPLESERPLSDGDVVTFGHFTLRFHRPSTLYRVLRDV